MRKNRKMTTTRRSKGGVTSDEDMDSDEEEKQVKDVLRLQQNRLSNEDFGAFESEEEESGSEQEESPQEQVHEAYDVEGKYFKTVVKDLKIYELKTAKYLLPISQAMRSGFKLLTGEGKKFFKKYRETVDLYCAHIYYYLYLISKDKTGVSHPVLRRLSDIKMLIEKYEPFVKPVLPTVLERLKGFEAEEPAEEEPEEEMVQELEEDSEASSEKPRTKGKKVQGRTAPVKSAEQIEKRKKLIKKKLIGLQKKKVQSFKLFPKGDEYVSEDEKEQEDVLALGKRDPKSKASGEISENEIMAGLKGMFDDDLNDEDNGKLEKPKATKRGKKLYEEFAKEKEEKHRQEQELKGAFEDQIGEFKHKIMFNDRKVSSEVPRTITQEMLQNKGLRRKREKVISKTKLRDKYDMAKRQDRVSLL
jgi:hypothetical protein